MKTFSGPLNHNPPENSLAGPGVSDIGSILVQSGVSGPMKDGGHWWDRGQFGNHGLEGSEVVWQDQKLDQGHLVEWGLARLGAVWQKWVSGSAGMARVWQD